MEEKGNEDGDENGQIGSEDSEKVVEGREEGNEGEDYDEEDSDKEDSSEQEEEVENESEQVQNVELRVIVEDVDTDTDSLVPVLDDHDEAERKLLD